MSGEWLYVGKGGNVWRYNDWLGQGNGKGGGKGKSADNKGKGKGGLQGAAKGGSKGGGKGKAQPGREVEHKQFYFDIFPERARGRQVLYCQKVGCFGSALIGDNTPYSCIKCGTPFDESKGRPTTRDRDSSQGRNSNKENSLQGQADDDTAQQTYEEMEKKGMSHEDILGVLKVAGLKYKPPRAKGSSATASLIVSSKAIEKANADIKQIDNQLVGKWSRHENLCNQLDTVIDEIEGLGKQKAKLELERQQHMQQHAGLVGTESVALATAKAVSND